MGCTLFITTLWPLGLAFFNSIKKFLSDLYFESFSTFFLLIIILLYVVQFQMIWNFQACRQLALKNESKEPPPFWTFFPTTVSLWSVATRFSEGQKRISVNSKAYICNLCNGNFWKKFHMFSSHHTKCAPEKIMAKKCPQN